MNAKIIVHTKKLQELVDTLDKKIAEVRSIVNELRWRGLSVTLDEDAEKTVGKQPAVCEKEAD